MLELVSILAEFLAKNLDLSSLSRIRKEQKLKALGTELFFIYILINEILVTGTNIVESLEKYVLQDDKTHDFDLEREWIARSVRVQLKRIFQLNFDLGIPNESCGCVAAGLTNGFELFTV